MNFENDYDELCQHARKVIKRYKLQCEDIDLVNDAFIEISSSEEPYSKQSAIKAIGRALNRESKNSTLPLNEHGFYKDGWKPQDSFCRSCKESFPIAAFTCTAKPNGTYVVYSICKKCYARKSREKYIKRPPRPRNFNKNEWYEKNREKWNAYIRQRYVKKYPNGRPKQDIHDLWKKANRKYYEKNRERILEKVKAKKALLIMASEPQAT